MGAIEVILVKCAGSSHENYRSVGERLFTEYHFSLEAARSAGEAERKKGYCVIIRPIYNEKDEQGVFFREWRSFDGEEFKEVCFRSPMNS